MEDLFYKGVRSRYVFSLRRKFANAKARAKTTEERDQLKKLKDEKNQLLEDLYNGEDVDFERLREVSQEIKELNQQIKNKTAPERNTAKELSKKIREYDNAIITLLNIDEHSEVRPPVDKAVENNEPAQALQIKGATSTKGVTGAKG